MDDTVLKQQKKIESIIWILGMMGVLPVLKG